MSTTVKIYAQIHGDDCNDVIHNHFDCPACKKEYASTSAYYDIGYFDDKTISCEDCGADFNIINYTGSEIELEEVKEGLK